MAQRTLHYDPQKKRNVERPKEDGLIKGENEIETDHWAW
jgi:hypothetical protein